MLPVDSAMDNIYTFCWNQLPYSIFWIFYNENKIIVDDEKLKDARIYLTYAVQIVIKTGAKLLGIDMPSKM